MVGAEDGKRRRFHCCCYYYSHNLVALDLKAAKVNTDDMKVRISYTL